MEDEFLTQLINQEDDFDDTLDDNEEEEEMEDDDKDSDSDADSDDDDELVKEDE